MRSPGACGGKKAAMRSPGACGGKKATFSAISDIGHSPKGDLPGRRFADAQKTPARSECAPGLRAVGAGPSFPAMQESANLWQKRLRMFALLRHVGSLRARRAGVALVRHPLRRESEVRKRAGSGACRILTPRTRAASAVVYTRASFRHFRLVRKSCQMRNYFL